MWWERQDTSSLAQKQPRTRHKGRQEVCVDGCCREGQEQDSDGSRDDPKEEDEAAAAATEEGELDELEQRLRQRGG